MAGRSTGPWRFFHSQAEYLRQQTQHHGDDAEQDERRQETGPQRQHHLDPELLGTSLCRMTTPTAQLTCADLQQLRRRCSGGVGEGQLSTELGKANAANERMSAPVAALAIIFMLILLGPAVLRVFTGAP